MVTLTPAELDQLTPSALKAHYAGEQKLVFGQDMKLKNGKPVEQGIGSPGNETENHFRAIEQGEREGREAPGTAKALREAWHAKHNPKAAKAKRKKSGKAEAEHADA